MIETDPLQATDDRQRRFRTYRLLCATALAWMLVRLMFVAGSNGTLPFLSANDRSRWCTIRALVDEGTYRIDDIIAERGWDTIDKVSHYGRDGQQHYYSSKPPLLPTMLAGIYWVIQRTTGLTLAEHPFLVGRTIIFLSNAIWLLILVGSLVRYVERWGQTDWGRVFVVAVATWGTFLFTFGVTLNNHLPAAAMCMVAIDGFTRIWYEGDRSWQRFAITGLASAFLAANELPAVSFLALIGMLLLWRFPRSTLLAFLPPVILVAAAFLGTNYLAHETMQPAYAHRAEGETWQQGNWYNYPGSYWLPENRKGIDRGERSIAVYAVHVLVGHHGIFSLTPVWCLSVAGCWMLIRGQQRMLAAVVILLTLVCLVFFIGLRPLQDRNYGGMTCGFRWMFWLIPLWLIALLPVADRLALSRSGRRWGWGLLAISGFSAAWGWFRPWIHPWPYLLAEWLTQT